jgi:CRISPR/Cas system-associated exonuclease Cas4 (RecB family)
MALNKLSRGELFTRLQVSRELDPVTDMAYKLVEERKHREQLDDSPHGDPWHVSFHASQFPGDDSYACPRRALYGLMDFAREAGDRKARTLPFDRKSRTIMAAGKAIELELVQTFSDAGILLSAKPSDEVQTGFQWPEAWLTGSVDCVIQWPETRRVVPIEIKSKYQSAIDEMKLAKRGPDLSHIFQLKTQLALVYYGQQNGGLWSDLDPVTHGYIYYLSRDCPSETAEFRVDLDLRFFEKGIARLKQWIAWFREDHLPEEPKGKRTTNFGHPMGAVGMKWSELPCAWCDYKKTCQLDFRQNIHTLTESVGVNRTQAAREHYDPEEARGRVYSRWE